MPELSHPIVESDREVCPARRSGGLADGCGLCVHGL
jgi:hypothetical protein